MNTEEAIALTLEQAWHMREVSYERKNNEHGVDKFGECKRSIEDCLIEAGKKNGLSDNMWALLNLAMHWANDCQSWSEDVLAGKNILEDCEKFAKEQEQERIASGEVEVK